ncbi:hypothetical protein BS50DRAFT_538843 [Corynespora cassiicola Philippines]|uniref:Beta-glucuronidase C-terminal domain-containing protein n=1 Tax=Corynespora cassiicola Philippines TaxID=1448308 RepID=A0A2T2P8E6_CORCC|nr:hypothetical protein BS50DRAFT_538843 [Corynespora cassiicola Philippines]
MLLGLTGAVPASPPCYTLDTTPSSPISQAHVPEFIGYSVEPSFWTEFFGEPDAPRELTFRLVQHLHERGAKLIIRPGGDMQDSMVYEPTLNQSVLRIESGKGGIYQTRIGPKFFESWDNFPEGTEFVATTNFRNHSLPIAVGLAVAAYEAQKDKIRYYELGNEPTFYPKERYNGSTKAYVEDWHRFTAEIDMAVNNDSYGKWWASSATTDDSGLELRPAALIPAGVNNTGQVGQYSIHTYEFASCDPVANELATINNIINHTDLVRYADEEVYPSAKAALDVGAEWIIGEFNSVACAGKPNVSDTFAQALWTVDISLIYAVRNATSVLLHQGAALLFKSNQQINAPGDDGSPGYASYSLLYPTNSTKRGEARVLPVFVSQLLITEALSNAGRIAHLPTPEGVDEDRFSAYAIYGEDDAKASKMVILNMKPHYAGNGTASTLWIDIGEHDGAIVKRMTAPSVDEKDAAKVTWAQQSFKYGEAVGDVTVEAVKKNGRVPIKDSEGVLVIFD